MKTSLLFSVCCAALLCHTSCRPEKPEQQPIPPQESGMGRILYPADSAIVDIASFDSLCAVHFPPNAQPAKAFTISAIDLLSALGMPFDSTACKFDYVRVYMGYNPQHQFKLFVVPVEGTHIGTPKDNAGRDCLLNANGHAVLPRPGSNDSTDLYVLDLNTPCPSTCDMGSPLMQNQ